MNSQLLLQKTKLMVAVLLIFIQFFPSFLQSQENDKGWKNSKADIVDVFSHDIFGNGNYDDTKKALKKLFKGSTDGFLAEFISSMEKGGQQNVRIQALRNHPFIFHVLLGAWYACNKKDSHEMYLNYSVAKEYVKDPKFTTFTEEDAVLVRKLIKFANKYESDCLPRLDKKGGAKDLFDFIAKESEGYKIPLIDSKNKKTINVDSLKQEKKNLEDRKTHVENDLSKLNKELEQKNIAITNLSSKNRESALRNLKDLKDKGILDKGEIDNKDLGGGALLRVKENNHGAPLSPKFENEGFLLGEFCSDQISLSIKETVTSLMEAIDFEAKYYQKTNPYYRDSVFINLTITGKADGTKIKRSTNGTCQLKYTGDEKISGAYYVGDSKVLTPVVVKRNDPICDDQLAFLRAHCAYKEVLAVLRTFKFPESNLSTTFIVRVYDIKGEKYRGSDVNISIENLFLEQLTEIKKLEEELKQIKLKIAELIILIKSQEKQLGDLEKVLEKILYLQFPFFD